MLQPIRSIVKYTSSQRGAKVTIIAWIVAVILLSALAPSAKEYETNGTEGSIRANTPSEAASALLDEEFPTDEGLTALLVFHRETGITQDDEEMIQTFSEWLVSEEKPEGVASSLPFHQFPPNVKKQLLSDGNTTLLFNIALEKNLESNEAHETLQKLRNQLEAYNLAGMDFEITGPAGIAADTISLFKDADFILMLATVLLIFIILIIIYRSPLLAITPLLIAGIVYGVVDRVLGLAGKYNLFTIEGQATSIMLVLLFAVLTDYSLFVFSRYREELTKHLSKYDSMGEAIYHVCEPIFFSGGTVLLAMLSLFVTLFNPYHYFAPVFTIAVIFILIAGLTLIPALFAVLGRKAFWPFIPNVNKSKQPKRRFWKWVSAQVRKRPAIVASSILVILLIGAANILTIQFSFNLLKSFPEDISSRQGFEILEENYPAGQLAPVTVILEANKKITVNKDFINNVNQLKETLEAKEDIVSVRPDLSQLTENGIAELPKGFLSKSEKAIKMEFVLNEHPYEKDAMDTINMLRKSGDELLANAQLSSQDYKLHYAGQTAQQLDVKQLNKRDMIILFTLVTVLLTLVLGLQTKSIALPIIMMGTILLSYASALGFSWWVVEHFIGYEAISYRLPVYAFIFMVALGIDYNIMLVSRMKEFVAEGQSWDVAIQKGITVTGGVISSAGLILAATFSVLMTQPLQELFLFGFMMALGILLDTFVIRGFLLPSILTLFHRFGWNKNIEASQQHVQEI
ncbi:MMPL family transporter [Virgibacillus sp. W0430]|uniref:MMPL family transporter n=1 Tax=Virgibacillus sp. W0430 TaxID=3391580 RepID=UPI003F4795DD